MATLKITLDKRRRKANNTYPIVIRLSHNQKSTIIPVNKSIEIRYWDENKSHVKKTFPLSEALNLLLQKEKLLLEEKIIKLGNSIDFCDVSHLKELLTKQKTKFISFFQFTNNEIENMINTGKIGNSIVYQCTISSVKKYRNNNDFNFNQITYQFLESFQSFLLAKGMTINAISVYLRTIRALYNKAIKLKIVDRALYPFADFKIKTQKTASRSIEKEDITKIETINLDGQSKINFYRDIFILIFNLIGISFTDLVTLKKENIINGRIKYRRKKTGKLYSIKITTKAEQLFKIYSGIQPPYLLPIMHLEKLTPLAEKHFIQQQLKNCNKYLGRMGQLCEINANLTTYYARYSWANIAKRMGYSKDLIAEALGHEYGNKVTGIYLDNYSIELIDEVNEKVTK